MWKMEIVRLFCHVARGESPATVIRRVYDLSFVRPASSPVAPTPNISPVDTMSWKAASNTFWRLRFQRALVTEFVGENLLSNNEAVDNRHTAAIRYRLRVNGKLVEFRIWNQEVSPFTCPQSSPKHSNRGCRLRGHACAVSYSMGVRRPLLNPFTVLPFPRVAGFGRFPCKARGCGHLPRSIRPCLPFA